MNLFDINKVSFEENSEVHQNAFCSIWETAKPALELLIQIIKNPIVKWVIEIVITVGDRVKQKVCGEGN